MSYLPSEGPQRPTFTQQADWTRSDQYHNSFLIKPDTYLTSSLERSFNEGLPDIAISEAQGKFLYLLVKSIKAKRILEVGTLGGYSTIWLAKAIPEDGKVISLELSPKNASVARENLVAANLSSVAQVLVGPAMETLLEIPSTPPFDLVFIDADKPNNLNYFKQAERVVRSGGIIIVDNVVRRGRVADPEIEDGEDAAVDGTRELLRYLKESEKVEATTVATVGAKGLDGFLYAIKNE